MRGDEESPRRPIDLTQLGIKELMQVEAGIIRELKRRSLVRTANKPVGDIAEQIVLKARGGLIEPNSTKSHDITTTSGQRIQVKGMTYRASGVSGKFSPFRSWDFGSAVFLVFNSESFDIDEAYEADPEPLLSGTRFSPHTNGRQPTLRQVRAIGRDITGEMREAFALLDHEGAQQ